VFTTYVEVKLINSELVITGRLPGAHIKQHEITSISQLADASRTTYVITQALRSLWSAVNCAFTDVYGLRMHQ
jgi:hypothetical protein